MTPPLAPAERLLPLVPYPAFVERNEGHFSITTQTPVTTHLGDKPAAKAADQFVAMLAEATGDSLLRHTNGSGTIAQAAPAIHFAIDSTLGLPPEAYTLHITPSGVALRAGDAAGLFYAGVTLWQLLTESVSPTLPADLPALRIKDRPRFTWRGFMIDSARHLQSTEQIKRLIDQAARHKLNTFHWHLTDDQGWRLEIKQYPKLTEIGAWRTPAGKAGRDATGQTLRYGGFYTQEEAREIVAYAAERHITIVPEVETPGHARAAIAAYPEFGSTGEQTTVGPEWGIHPFIYDVSDATFAFLENILREVMDIFPGSYIHIGGDEAVKLHWKRTPAAQAKIRELGLADENALQSWFIRRLAQFLTANNRKLIGWDEILDGGPLPEGANVMVWNKIENAAIATQSGHDVVMTPTQVTYLNRVQSLAHDEPPGHDYVTTLQRVYEFEPVPPEVDEAATQHIIGYQANLWTEYIRTPEQVEHMLYPRLSAVAENAWSPASQRNWKNFLPRIAVQLRRMVRAGLRPADSAFAVQIEPLPTVYPIGRACYIPRRFRLWNQADFGELRYTLDGSEPRLDSPLYTQPIPLGKLPVTVTTNAFFDGLALAKPRAQVITADSLRTRSAEQLVPQIEERPLRLEDDEPVASERLAVPVTIYRSVGWIWKDAMLEGIRRLQVEVADLPYNFAFANESVGTEFDAPAPVYLQVYLDQRESPPVAQVLVNPKHSTPIQTLSIPLPERNDDSTPRDLLFEFTGSKYTGTARETLWAIYNIRLCEG